MISWQSNGTSWDGNVRENYDVGNHDSQQSEVASKVVLSDPFIILRRGKHYAYGTDSPRGISVYGSDDLLTWTESSLCTTQRITYLCGDERLTAWSFTGPWTKYENNPFSKSPVIWGVGHRAMFTDMNGELRIVYDAHIVKRSSILVTCTLVL